MRSSRPPGLLPSKAPLYRRELGALRAAGIVRVDEAGVYRDAAAPTTRQRSAPPPPPMLTLVVRVPQDAIAALDALGPTRSEAARAVLAAGLAKTG